MVTLGDAYRAARAQLREAGVEDAAFDAQCLCRAVSGRDPRALPDYELTQAQEETFRAMCADRARRRPLQYILGEWDFLDFTLRVGEGVLIPRSDTEVTALEAARLAGAAPGEPVVLDLCAGSGAIAAAVARRVPRAHVTAVEKYDDAMRWLRENLAALAPHARAVQADVFGFEHTLAPASADVIVSNPPYVTEEEMRTLEPELAFEPRTALEAPDEGLQFYRHIARAYRAALKPGGALVFEVGDTQGQAVRAILTENGFSDICVLPDAEGRDRCVRGIAP